MTAAHPNAKGSVPSESEAALFARFVSRRSPEDFEAFVARMHGFAYSVALGVCSNPALAEESVQETFLLIAQSSSLNDPPRDAGAFRGWFFKVVENVSRHCYRSERRTIMRAKKPAFLERNGDVPGARIEPEATFGLQREEDLAALRHALSDLSEEQRLPLVLHYLEGLSQTEIGQMVGLSTSHVSRRIARALDLLRLRLMQAGVTLSVAALPALMGRLYPSPHVSASELARYCLRASRRTAAPADLLRIKTTGSMAWIWIAAGLAMASVVITMYLSSAAQDARKPVTQSPLAASESTPPTGMLPLPQHWNFNDGPAMDIKRVSENWSWEKAADGTKVLLYRGKNAGWLLLPVEVRNRPFKVSLSLLPPSKRAGFFGAHFSDGIVIPFRTSWCKYNFPMDYGAAFTLDIHFVGKLEISSVQSQPMQVIEYEGEYPARRVCILVSPTVAIKEIRIEEVSEGSLPSWAVSPEAELKRGKIPIKKESFEAWTLPLDGNGTTHP